ncbi:sigma-70 family RNA polymerase sigma factor [Candidatus Parcubacteria bacterium]|nr:MAG: sigma-70 family RNA polymerase sigma factor [Candidatus Parcubacteria bacterium]
MENSDIDIVKRAKANTQVFEELYKKYADKVYNYFWYRTGHQKDVAEDLMQETFFRAFKHLGRFQNRGYSYLTYLLTIAHNVLANYYRSKKMIPLSELGEIGEDFDVPAEITDSLERKSEAEALWRAIQDLSGTERDAILMFYQKEMPIKDISRVMGRTENAIKLILSRARKKLAKHPYLRDMVGYADQERAYTKPRFLKVKKE